MQSVPRCYKRDKLGAVVSQPVKTRPGGWCEMAASLGVSQLWDIRQPLRTLAEDTVKIRYQETKRLEKTKKTLCVLQLQ
jgi:hypothetical protein